MVIGAYVTADIASPSKAAFSHLVLFPSRQIPFFLSDMGPAPAFFHSERGQRSCRTGIQTEPALSTAGFHRFRRFQPKIGHNLRNEMVRPVGRADQKPIISYKSQPCQPGGGHLANRRIIGENSEGLLLPGFTHSLCHWGKQFFYQQMIISGPGISGNIMRPLSCIVPKQADNH